jgi:hypothetical protein
MIGQTATSTRRRPRAAPTAGSSGGRRSSRRPGRQGHGCARPGRAGRCRAGAPAGVARGRRRRRHTGRVAHPAPLGWRREDIPDGSGSRRAPHDMDLCNCNHCFTDPRVGGQGPEPMDSIDCVCGVAFPAAAGLGSARSGRRSSEWAWPRAAARRRCSGDHLNASLNGSEEDDIARNYEEDVMILSNWGVEHRDDRSSPRTWCATRRSPRDPVGAG